MSFLNFEINELMIQIITNLPSDQDKPRAFSRDMLYIPPAQSDAGSNKMYLAKYPFITADVKYPKKYLYGLNYQDRLNFFFNKNEFANVLKSRAKKNNGRKSPGVILERNVLVMLGLLFPTSFPTVDNIGMSNDLLAGDLTKTYTSRRNGLLGKLSGEVSPAFSYLRIENKTYTVQKVVWLNDMLNHPLYSKLLEKRKATQSESDYNNRIYLNRLREFRTTRKSTNADLQQMIGASPDQLSKFLDYVRGRYLDHTADINPTFDKLTNVGVSIIADRGQTVPSREIYLMVDLLDGEISDTNTDAITCAYTGELLGNQVKYLLDHSNDESGETWNAFRNRNVINSISPNTPISSNQTAQDVRSRDQLNSEINILQSNFEQMIASENLDNAYSAILDKYPSATARAPAKVIDFLKESSVGSANKLYELIKEWNKSFIKTNVDLLNRMSNANSTIEREIKDFKRQLENNSNPDTIVDIQRMVDTYALYKMILAEVMLHEKNKSTRQGGTTRRARRRYKRKGKKTRKNRSFHSK
jgi:hypothetical protein